MADTAIGSGMPAVDPSAAARKGADRQETGEKAGSFGTVLERARGDDHAKAQADSDKTAGDDKARSQDLQKRALIDLRLNGRQAGAVQDMLGDGAALQGDTMLPGQGASAASAIKIAKIPKHPGRAPEAADADSSALPEIAADPKENGSGHETRSAKTHKGAISPADRQQQTIGDVGKASAESDTLSLLASADTPTEPVSDGKAAKSASNSEILAPSMVAVAAMPDPATIKAEGGAAKGGEGIARIGKTETEATQGEDPHGSSKAAEPHSGRAFRFARADGRTQTLNMAVGGPAREGAQESRNAPVETVTVLDARRYLALSQNSNTVLNNLSGDAEWSGAMQPANALSNAATMASTGKVVNTLKIQIHPMTLGMVTATMRLAGDELRVDLAVETAAAYRQLSDDKSGLVEALRAQGFAVDQVSVTLVSPSDRSDGSGAQAGGQNATFGQQTQDGNASPRRDDRYAAQGNGTGGESVADDKVGIAGPGDGVRPGQLYL